MFTQVKQNTVVHTIISEYDSKEMLLYLLYNDDLDTRGTYSTYLNKEKIHIEMEHTSARKLVINLSFNERESNKETRILPDKQDRT